MPSDLFKGYRNLEFDPRSGILPLPDVQIQNSALVVINWINPTGIQTTTLPGVARIAVVRDTLVYIGTSAPADDSTAMLIPTDQVAMVYMPPGQKLYLKRIGNNNGQCSVSLWFIQHV